MAGSIELSTQGITSPFMVDMKTPDMNGKTPEYQKPEVVKETKGPSEVPGIPAQEKAVADVADALNSVSKAIDRNLQFSVDKETGRIVIKVTDGDTGDVIRVIPPDQVSKMRDSFGSLVGLLFADES